MNPFEWLCLKAPGFRELTDDEHNAIMHFSLLWSFFEAKALQNNASVSRIHALVHKWESDGRLNITSFNSCLAYFRERYFYNGIATAHFGGLNLRGRDICELVSAVLKEENIDQVDCVSVVLLVVFRLRNNLFHGIKWAYDIRGQLDNFKNANAALIAALEIHGNF